VARKASTRGQKLRPRQLKERELQEVNRALRAAGGWKQLRTVAIPGAGHFFVTDPVDDTSFGGFAGPKVVRFLKDVL
jgi:hypothetical protein